LEKEKTKMLIVKIASNSNGSVKAITGLLYETF